MENPNPQIAELCQKVCELEATIKAGIGIRSLDDLRAMSLEARSLRNTANLISDLVHHYISALIIAEAA